MNTREFLRGKSVVVTRPELQAQQFLNDLEVLGAKAVCLPVIKVSPTENYAEIQNVVDNFCDFDWVVFSSANGVSCLMPYIEEGQALARLRACRLAAIGSATAKVMEKYIRKPDLLPKEFVSESLFEALGDVAEKKFLVVRAKQGRELLAGKLVEAGATVKELTVYQVTPNLDRELEEIAMQTEKPDFITFSSSSTVHAFFALDKRCHLNWLHTAHSVCIGPITAGTLRDYGFEPYRVAKSYSVEGMLEALMN